MNKRGEVHPQLWMLGKIVLSVLIVLLVFNTGRRVVTVLFEKPPSLAERDFNNLVAEAADLGREECFQINQLGSNYVLSMFYGEEGECKEKVCDCVAGPDIRQRSKCVPLKDSGECSEGSDRLCKRKGVDPLVLEVKEGTAVRVCTTEDYELRFGESQTS